MTDQVLFYNSINDDVIEKLVNTMSSDVSADDTSGSFKGKADNEESDGEPDDAPITRTKKRFHQFSDSTSESDNDILEKHQNNGDDEKIFDMGGEDTSTKNNGYKQKSRIRTLSSSDNELKGTVKKTNEKYDLSRIKNKKNKLRNKFRNLASKQNQRSNMEIPRDEELDSRLNNNINSDKSDDEQVSCNKIKQSLKEKHMMKISSICDPDSSDDEDVGEKKLKKKSSMKSTRLTSPKPIKISANQAMENMQKIKSESNRMLREKEVSLPYHRPKALSLKDIMSRRKPALAPDGKVLSIKMTPEQLEQYALQLEQRQKEMMELCKSDTDEDDDMDKKEDQNHEAQKTDDKTNIQEELENNTPNVTKMDTQTDLTEMVNEDKVNEMDSETCVFSEHSKSTECTLNVESVDVDKDSNDTNSFENVKEIDTFKGNNEILNGVDGDKVIDNINNSDVSKKNNNKDDSQMMELHYDSEKIDSINLENVNEINENTNHTLDDQTNTEFIDSENADSEFLENILNFDEIDAIMENIKDKGDNGKHIPEISLNTKPKLTGAPGMIIDLDNNTLSDNKLTGVEQLKERFKYFARLKSLEEQEKDREKKYKPGVQHLKLKQELEEQIAEQRSLEWATRLEQEKQQQLELNAIRGDDIDIDDIEKVEAKLEQLNDSHVSNNESSGSESAEEEEICEDDCIIEDKPRKRNPMIDEEAEETDNEEDASEISDQKNIGKEDDCIEDFDASDKDSSDDESSESDEDEETDKPKKGRILKAFEDSDDEEINDKLKEKIDECVDNCETSKVNEVSEEDLNISSTQDDELQLAQVPKTSSEEIIISQDPVTEENKLEKRIDCDEDLGSQTFSIANTGSDTKCLDDIVAKETKVVDRDMFADDNLYSTRASQNIDSEQELNTPTQSQEIGDDILALCTGKFYDNPFVSQLEGNILNEDKTVSNTDMTNEKDTQRTDIEAPVEKEDIINQEKLVLSSILEELDNPQFESPKQYKYFVNDDSIGNKEYIQRTANKSVKKKLVIDSDDEVNEGDAVEQESKKKNKKRKLEKRALQFSDDEEDIEEEIEETEVLESDMEEDPDTDIEGDPERIVEYDSEENEVEVQPQKKKKRVGGDFFEQEAELTSEDEWVGSGDEDEAGLDRMEREEGDDDVFHEGKLRKELGQIHMRDVLDQDKREVRLLQELLFEDGDLGDGHRQRKFRWKNADDTDETGAAADEFADTQEEEFESEEHWRKQRHEREMFLRKMKGEDDDLNNTSINRSAIIKANLCSRTTTSVPAANASASENRDKETVQEKKTHKDIPSPKKPFAIFQQNYHGSLLSRGKGALARLAAIATPLADDGDAPKVSTSTNRRNFVFAALSQDQVEPKVSKRKADTIAPSPVLIKKLKAEENQKQSRNSLFDYLEG